MNGKAMIARTHDCDDWFMQPGAPADMLNTPQCHNARLIAAAPELLEALETMLAWTVDIPNIESARNRAKAAIEKAKQ